MCVCVQKLSSALQICKEAAFKRREYEDVPAPTKEEIQITMEVIIYLVEILDHSLFQSSIQTQSRCERTRIWTRIRTRIVLSISILRTDPKHEAAYSVLKGVISSGGLDRSE